MVEMRNVIAGSRVLPVGTLGAYYQGPMVRVTIDVVAKRRQSSRATSWVQDYIKAGLVFGRFDD